MGVVSKRSTMTYFSDPNCHYSHRVRIVLAEKGITVDVVNSDPLAPTQELAELNPYGTLPTLLDRELVLYQTPVIMEYLDERFPHPPLLPVYPVARAEIRQFIHRIQDDWCSLIDKMTNFPGTKDAQKAAKQLEDSLVTIAPVFGEKPYFMSDEFTIVDCCLAPILWRLDDWGISIPKTRQTLPLFNYMERMFNRESFQASLTDFERDLRTNFAA